jgi:hypothetical protein
VHDPLSVIFDVLRPWPKRLHRHPLKRSKNRPRPWFAARQYGPLNVRPRYFPCAHCDDGKVRDPVPSYQERHVYGPGDDCPDCAGRGFNVVPRRKRLYFGWHFWRFGAREFYFPPLVTVWHVDPEVGGDDDSCGLEYRRRQRLATLDGDRLGEWWWWFVYRKYRWWHVTHWSVQVHPWQRLQRWRNVRCPGCGERFGWDEAGIAPGFHADAWHFKCAETRGFGMQAGEQVAAEPTADV